MERCGLVHDLGPHQLLHGDLLAQATEGQLAGIREWQEHLATVVITAAPLEQLCVAEAFIRGGIHIAAHLTGLRQLVMRVLIEVATLLGIQQPQSLLSRDQLLLHGLEERNGLFGIGVTVASNSPLCGEQPIMQFWAYQTLPHGLIHSQPLTLHRVQQEACGCLCFQQQAGHLSTQQPLLKGLNLTEALGALPEEVVGLEGDDPGLVQVFGSEAAAHVVVGGKILLADDLSLLDDFNDDDDHTLLGHSASLKVSHEPGSLILRDHVGLHHLPQGHGGATMAATTRDVNLCLLERPPSFLLRIHLCGLYHLGLLGPSEWQEAQACLGVLHTALQQLQVGEVLMRVGVEEALGVVVRICQDAVHLFIEVATLVGHIHRHAMAVDRVDDAPCGNLSLQQADAMVPDDEVLLHGLKEGDLLPGVGVLVASDSTLGRQELVVQLRTHNPLLHSLIDGQPPVPHRVQQEA
ncbi:hypothetical protein U0070_023693 [Myodes glareolus]|uniref:Uncharacterized protein n=1 Tax=Myodes glareolus TaxID=447135 RepID=A0AAW0H9F8_MYOGA